MSEPFSEIQKRITKDSVIAALFKLLKNKSFIKITITEITKVAGVSRTAFYRNFQTKDDIVICHLNDLFKELLSKLVEPGCTNKQTRTKAFFSFFLEHRNFVTILIKADLTPILYEQFCIHVTDFFRHQTDKLSNSILYEKYLPQYIASGLFKVLIEWVNNGNVESVNEISNFVFEITGS